MPEESGEMTTHTDLVQGAVTGDHDAIERLLLRHFGALESRIRRRLPIAMHGVLGTEDVIQETFVLVFKNINTFDVSRPHCFSAWLFAIADRKLAEMVRNQQAVKRGGRHVRVHARFGDSTDDIHCLLMTCRHTPSQSAARIEAIRALRNAMSELPDDHRSALELRYFEGQSFADVANVLGRTPGAVQTLCHRAIKRLAELLGARSAFMSC